MRRLDTLLLSVLTTATLAGCHETPAGTPASSDRDTPTETAASTAEAAEAPTAGSDAPDAAAAHTVHAAVPGRVVAGSPTWLDARGTELPDGVDADVSWSCSDGTRAQGVLTEVTFADAGDVRCVVELETDTVRRSGMLDITVHDTPAQWTVMVFVNGDNNLESAALDDLMEMEVVGSTDDVQVVVQMDRAEGYSAADGDWTTARRYLVGAARQRGIQTRYLEDLGEVDSGDWRTMAELVEWSAEHFPAERYAFVMWNHGEGWKSMRTEEGAMRSISDDDESHTTVSIAGGDLEEFLHSATRTLGQPLDLLGADACLMQTFELGWVAAPYADYFVGSQEVEGNDGWPYDTILADLAASPDMDGGALGERIATRFQASKDRTQSVVDLQQVDALATALDALAIALLDSPDGAAQVLDAADPAWSSSYNPGNRDLGQLLDRLVSDSPDPRVRAAASAARLQLDATVPTNRTYGYDDGTAPTGMSIYTGDGDELEPLYAEADWSRALLWDDLLTQALTE